MERLHIAFFGPTNSGKSTLVNAIAGQQVSLVSAVPGTTTDPVRKPIEIPGLGPCVLIDTAGLDDTGILGAERQRLTRAVLDETDVAVVLSMAQQTHNGSEIASLAAQAGIPVIEYTRGESVESLIRRIQEVRPVEEEPYLTGDLVAEGDTVLLVMPQDSEAPKGRLILPQVQVIRELLDRRCNALCCTPQSLASAIAGLQARPALVITDSQVFSFVNAAIPGDWPLTSFSVLLAAAKGDTRVFVEGARAISRLTAGSRVLIAEACSHVPDTEDIGRVKIPALLRQRCGALTVDVSAGNDFPDDLTPYDLVIHCGACVAGRRVVRARTRKALLSGVPITNYGIALAFLQGILDRIVMPDSRNQKRSS